MDPYYSAPLWDLSQPSSFSQLPDDDFLLLLQKQFPSSNGNLFNPAPDSVNPQSITPFALPSLSPPSDDSNSPSPPQANGMDQADHVETDDHDPALKRKASSDEDFDEGPNSKNQHTSGSANRKGSARRKLSGGGGPDEGRLLKRKEQNRAAQRAFRERKEKHVKDLEDKVAALQARNDQAQSENENLRDLLSRLQNENVVLKNSSFTFSVPKRSGNDQTVPSVASVTQETPRNSFASGPRTASSPPDGSSTPSTTQSSDNIDWNSLTAFDPSVLKLLDETPQQTATDGAMNMDFGFGSSDPSSSVPYTTLASNQFMTFADTYDSPSSMSTGTPAIPFNFDMQSLASWPTPQQQVDGNVRMQNSESLEEELFGGHYMDTGGPVDINALLHSPPSTLSPVIHANIASTVTSGSSPASNLSLFNTPRESSASEEDHNDDTCPKTKEEVARRIASEGSSPFAPAPSPAPMLRKGSDGLFGTMVTCKGANFPSTEKNEQNIEVLSAWRSITSKFKDADVNDLCAEFTKKARCDGTKVVLEPQGVNSIIETLESKKR